MEQAEEPSTQKVKSYQRIKLSLSIASLLIDAAAMIILILSGWSLEFFNWCRTINDSSLIQFLLFILSIGVSVGILTFPLSFTSGYIIEHKFKLSNQTLIRYFNEQAKGLLVALVIGVPVLIFFYLCLTSYHEMWWLPMSIGTLLLSLLLTRIAPVIIIPLFYKQTLLPESLLRERIEHLCKEHRLNITGIFEINLSKDTRKANAAFTGIGKSKRVLLADTLLQSFSEDEIISIFAHELGHHRHKHIWKGIILSAVHTFVTFYISSVMLLFMMRIAGFETQNFVPALPLLALSLSLIGILSAPFFNAISRKHEREADRYAVKLCGRIEPFVSAFERLASMNLADKQPHPLVEFLFYSHPSIQKRILAIQQTSFQ